MLLGEKPTARSVRNYIKEHPESYDAEYSQKIIDTATEDLGNAFAKFFSHKAKYPRFKSKKKARNHLSFRFYRKNDTSIRIRNKHFELDRHTKIKLTEDLRFVGVIKTATIKFENGFWFICVSVELSTERTKVDNQQYVGIDYGETDFFTTSDGEKINPSFKFEELDKVKRFRMRELSHKKYGSNNYFKAKAKLEKVNREIKNKKDDFFHKASSQLAEKYSHIAVEDISTIGMTKKDKNRKRRKNRRNKMCFTPWRDFISLLSYKAFDVQTIDKYFPSSQVCSVCGEIHEEMKDLNRRLMICECGNTLDRDINAAINIKTVAFGKI